MSSEWAASWRFLMRTLFLLPLLIFLTSCSQWHAVNKEFSSLKKRDYSEATEITTMKRPPSIPSVQKRLKEYYSTGQYNKTIEKAVNAATKYLSQQAQFSISKHIAIVLDVDETSLSNKVWIEKNLLTSPLQEGVGTESFSEWKETGKDTAIFQLLSIYQLAQDKGINVFFISERPESMREITELNLIKQGYNQHHKLILMSDEDKEHSISHYKTSARRKISQEGYKILANIGDQKSDLEGGYSDRSYKLPNPFYTVP